MTSPLLRARQTAEAVAGGSGCRCDVDDGVAECDFGEWEGLTFAEVEERWPDELAAWLGVDRVAPPGGGERSTRCCAGCGRPATGCWPRTRPDGGRGLARDPDQDAGAAWRWRRRPAPLYRMELAPASLSTVAWFADGNASLRSLNDTQHLDGLLPHQHV